VAKVREKRLCGAKKRQGDGNCSRPAGWGTQHVGWGKCKLHGGSGPGPTKGAETQRMDHEARELFGKLVPGEAVPVTNPLAVYAEFAGRVMVWMNTMDGLLDDLRSPRFLDDKGAEQIRGEVQLFERAMDRCNSVLAAYARLKIDERLVAITEGQKSMVIAAIDRAFAAAGITGEAAAGAKQVAARHLRVVDAA